MNKELKGRARKKKKNLMNGCQREEDRLRASFGDLTADFSPQQHHFSREGECLRRKEKTGVKDVVQVMRVELKETLKVGR